jgi:hypothetical protein
LVVKPGCSTAFCILFFVGAGFPLTAGPLLDDYLNHARLGERCPAGGGAVELASGRPLGQSFAVAPGTGEIYRIGLQADSGPASWGETETVTLALYDGPAKAKKLAAAAIDGRTCRVQPNRNTREKERVLLFPLRAKLADERSLYFELTVEGGDGRVRFMTGDYAGGVGREGGEPRPWDLAFETHIKPAADPDVLHRSLWQRFDLDHPPLAAVKAAVTAGDQEKAVAEAVKHFDGRRDLYDPWAAKDDPAADPSFDRTRMDRLLEGFLWRKDGADAVPWRKASYWAPDYPGIGKNVEPGIYAWHLQRHLATAWLATGDAKYARAAIDLRMQWILDNCPSYRVTGINCPHEIWNELIASHRAPGHGTFVYARLGRFPGWTDDEKLVFFLSWYDNAEYLFESEVGGNWGFQTAKACYDFGKTFPEYRKSRAFAAWGARRLCDLTRETVRPDGTEHEAAVKYHAMCARRLKGLLEDHTQGTVKLDDALVPVLRKHLEGMYEHMAHTLQPDRRVVMCGDSWYEDFSAEVAEVGRMLGRPDFVWIGTAGKEGTPPTEASKTFPDGGYFILRSDFGGGGRPYEDARQLFVHNGGWVGSHGHLDLLSIALYAYGRTLLIDPGQYDYEPPPGIDRYWTSRVHSMLVPNGWDCEREPGPTRWASSAGFDALDGIHHGYRKRGVPEVRRRIVFVKPDYFVVDDTAVGREPLDWEQVWNIAGSNVKAVAAGPGIETTHPNGGNLVILPVLPSHVEMTRRRGGTKMAGEGYSETSIVGFRGSSLRARFRTVLFPWTGARPDIEATYREPEDDQNAAETAVRVRVDAATDWIVWREAATGGRFRKGPSIDGDLLVVRTPDGRSVRAFSWFRARRASFDADTLAEAGRPLALLDVAYEPGRVVVHAREEDPDLRVRLREPSELIVNGRSFGRADPDAGYVRPFADAVRAIVVDDDSPGFRRLTKTEEWEPLPNADAYGLHYTTHEADPGRSEAAEYWVELPAAGRYRVEAFVPKTGRLRSDAVHYIVEAVPGAPAEPAAKGGAIRNVDSDAPQGRHAVVVDQQAATGWIDLGGYAFPAGERPVLTAINRSATDGVYPAFDAVRLTPVGAAPRPF